MTDPIATFSAWLNDAKHCTAIAEPTAMTLATATTHGAPSARIVLLKDHDAQGFVFYTNTSSRKGEELKQNPHAALCFYWMPLERQVRIEGRVEPVSAAEADAYFATRVRGKQIGAWSSLQSQPLPERDQLLQRIDEFTAHYEGKDVPRPPHWSGWRVVPERIEFWSQGEFRLHEREVFTRHADGRWQVSHLYP